ncbi:peptide transporter [Collinsella sp. An7]|uniref:OPT/YSL family transporter n=1 Tax=Collinsella sp. An7 TaxID=1965651 RepID=UPI000B38578F|nr:OPT/YSL family transporter [Collinsella sp. An7]OUN47719.1 peptide transporter [Collinsella sp. An7]
MQKPATRASLRGQLSAAGILIGCVGCVVITASSVYTALKMGSLPWPTIFTSITALVLLRAVGNTSLNEANITQVIMSAGSMVAGGLAFTIPGVWILGLADEVSWGEMLAVALAGTLLGLVCTSVIRRRFVEQSDLPYPIGTAAAETLIASRAGGETGRRLFASMALAGLWGVARDILGLMPALISSSALPGVALGIQNSPMRLAVGFLAGRRSMAWWAFGAVAGWLGIVTGGTALGLWNVSAAQGIVSSLGMGLMMGAGVGVVFKDVILAHVLGRGRRRSVGRGAGHVEAARWPEKAGERAGRVRFAWLTERPGLLALMVAAAALVLAFVLRLPPVACAVIVTLSFVTAVMSAQSVGQSGIDPMEIFGLIVLLMVAALSSTTQVQLFFVAGVIAVACGLAGDVMSDFKTGQIIGTDPHVLWIGQVIGALLGTGVAVAVLVALVAAYGPNAFGPDALFVSAQANVVATMVAGIPSVPAFVLGLAAGGVLYVAGIPSMMLGLGVYLPFYMTLTTVLGALVRLGWDRLQAARGAAREEADEAGIVIASGVLGGESIVGVVVALATAAGGLLG